MFAVSLAESCRDLDNSGSAPDRHAHFCPPPTTVSPDAPEIEVLRRGRWFASLPPALQARIAQLGVLRRFRAGQYVVREGDRMIELVD